MTQHLVVFVPNAIMNHLWTVEHSALNVTGGFMTAVDRLIKHSAIFASDPTPQPPPIAEFTAEYLSAENPPKIITVRRLSCQISLAVNLP